MELLTRASTPEKKQVEITRGVTIRDVDLNGYWDHSRDWRFELLTTASRVGLELDFMSNSTSQQEGIRVGEIYLWKSRMALEGKMGYGFGCLTNRGDIGQIITARIMRAIQRYNNKIPPSEQIPYGVWYIHIYHIEGGEDKVEKLKDWTQGLVLINFDSEDDLLEELLRLTLERDR